MYFHKSYTCVDSAELRKQSITSSGWCLLRSPLRGKWQPSLFYLMQPVQCIGPGPISPLNVLEV